MNNRNETVRGGERIAKKNQRKKKNFSVTNKKMEENSSANAANNAVNFQIAHRKLEAISDCAYPVAKESEGKVKQRTTIRRFESWRWPAWGKDRASTFAT